MKLKDQIRFYYLKATKPGNPGLHPFGCVALVVNDGKIYRGVSLCSPRDQFSKETGKHIAAQNAKFLQHVHDFGVEGDKDFQTSGKPRDRIYGKVGGPSLQFSLWLVEGNYKFKLREGDRYYCKARVETWDSLTDMERHIFVSNDKPEPTVQPT